MAGRKRGRDSKDNERERARTGGTSGTGVKDHDTAVRGAGDGTAAVGVTSEGERQAAEIRHARSPSDDEEVNLSRPEDEIRNQSDRSDRAGSQGCDVRSSEKTDQDKHHHEDPSCRWEQAGVGRPDDVDDGGDQGTTTTPPDMDLDSRVTPP
ncbi:hypothetical protein HDU93_007931, partial [Gonapodya sp. JEL0774]